MKLQRYVAAAALILLPVFSARAQSNEEFEQKIEQYLKTKRGQEAAAKAVETYFREQQANEQRKQAESESAAMEEQFKNPVKVDIGNAATKGPKDAKVTIVEFSDFQCPFCTRGKDTMDKVLAMYPNQVRLAFKNFPLPMHPQGVPAAKAALAAGKQGKFWEMHDALFANQGKLDAAFYEKEAQQLGLDVERFKTDMQSKEIEDQVQQEIKQGQEAGVQGTPGFFVNGVFVAGAYPPDYFKKLIDRWLAQK